MTQAELPLLPAHALMRGSVPNCISKPFVAPRCAKGASLSGPRVQATPTDSGRAAREADGTGGGGAGGAGSEDEWKTSVPALVPDTQEAVEAERSTHQVAADDGAPQLACNAAAAGVRDAANAPPAVPACASASCNPR